MKRKAAHITRRVLAGLYWLADTVSFPVYRYLFFRRYFYGLHQRLFIHALKGMGILNYRDGNFTFSGEKSFLMQLFKNTKKAVVFDIGAYTGEYSKIIMELVPNATVYAFEPHPVTFGKLQETAGRLSFKAFNMACGNREGFVPFYDHRDNDGSTHASLYNDVIEKIQKSQALCHRVRIIRLDDFVENNGIDAIDLLKVDTEGSELDVLKGLKRFIRANRVKVIQFEFNETNIPARVFVKDFYDFLTNYDFYRILPYGLVPLGKYNPLFTEMFAYQNLVAVNRTAKT